MGSGDLVDLVFEGGGIKGIGLVGALSVLEEHGYQVRCRAGASAGAIVASLHAAGYSATELRDILMDFDFRHFLDEGWEDRIPLVGKPLGLLFELGIFEGDAFERWIAERLAERGVVTFADLRCAEPDDDPRFDWKLQVVVSDVTTHEMVLLPLHAREKLGIEPDELSVAAAVRASMSIPIVFEPKRLPCAIDGAHHLFVDGGMLSNFPVWAFDTELPDRPTFGLRLVEDSPRQPVAHDVPDLGLPAGPRLGAIGYALALLQTMIEAHDRMYMEQQDFARTIPIKTLGVGTLDFGLTRERKQELFESGRAAAEEFLPFDFEGWVRAFRGREAPSRRQTVRHLMQSAPSPSAGPQASTAP